MSKDFARVSSRGERGSSSGRKKSGPPPSRWPAFYAGLVLGLGVAVLVYLVDRDVISPQRLLSEMPGQHGDPAAPVAEPTLKPRFDFYTILPEMEVMVPEREAAAVTPKPASSPPPVALPDAYGTYLLQAGSFRKMKDADALKARLALLGFHARIEVVSIDQNTYHRVRIGPYTSFAEADVARTRLRAERVDTMLLKLRK